jgi:mono/diheme cytochrome c family protein
MFFKKNKVLVVLAVFSISCSKQGDPISDRVEFASKQISEKNVTYKNFVEPLLTKNCSTCHGANGSAEAWWLNTKTYENAVEYANPIAKTIIRKTMPPPPKFPFTDRDRDLIQAWIDRGMPNN